VARFLRPKPPFAEVCVPGGVGPRWWAALGHLEVLEWARANGCPMDVRTYLECALAVPPPSPALSRKLTRTAAMSGRLEALKVLRAGGCDWGVNMCATAARNGHFEVLKWCRANGCPWDEQTCLAAACRGHLEMLEWARANGGPWDEETCSIAAMMVYISRCSSGRACQRVSVGSRCKHTPVGQEATPVPVHPCRRGGALEEGTVFLWSGGPRVAAGRAYP